MFTIPLFLAGKYTIDGGRVAADHATAWKHLKTLLILGLADKVSAWLDNAVTNNWANDTYVWSQEVVVVTGGSDGIGKIVVHLLAEKGIKVAVLDVQELTYEGKTSLPASPIRLLLIKPPSATLRPLLPLRPHLALVHQRCSIADPQHPWQPYNPNQQRRRRARQDDSRHHRERPELDLQS